MNDYMQINDNNNDNTNVCMNIYIHESPLSLLEELLSHVCKIICQQKTYKIIICKYLLQSYRSLGINVAPASTQL